MTKIIDGVHVKTYEEWLKIPEIQEIEEQIEECHVCDGEGEHTCDCGDEHTCGNCNGSGKVDDLKNIYQNTLKTELEKLLKWRKSFAPLEETQL